LERRGKFGVLGWSTRDAKGLSFLLHKGFNQTIGWFQHKIGHIQDFLVCKPPNKSVKKEKSSIGFVQLKELVLKSNANYQDKHPLKALKTFFNLCCQRKRFHAYFLQENKSVFAKVLV